MFGYYEIYNKDKQYLTPEGKVYTFEMFEQKYPAVDLTKMAVLTYDDIILDASPFNNLRSQNAIRLDVPDDEALKILTDINNLKETESNALDRIAAVLEFFMMKEMEDKA